MKHQNDLLLKNIYLFKVLGCTFFTLLAHILNLNCSVLLEGMQDYALSLCGTELLESQLLGQSQVIVPSMGMAQFLVMLMFLQSAATTARCPSCHVPLPGFSLRDLGWPGPMI